MCVGVDVRVYWSDGKEILSFSVNGSSCSIALEFTYKATKRWRKGNLDDEVILLLSKTVRETKSEKKKRKKEKEKND
jgi:hypothetical protein